MAAPLKQESRKKRTRKLNRTKKKNTYAAAVRFDFCYTCGFSKRTLTILRTSPRNNAVGPRAPWAAHLKRDLQRLII